MNNKSQNVLSQQKGLNDPKISACVDFLLGLSGSSLLIFNHLIGLSNKLDIIYVSQAYLGSRSGVTREHANRMISRLWQAGVLHKEFRPMETCLYNLPSFFNNFEVRESLRHMYSACKYLPLTALLSLGDEMKSLNSMIGVNQFNQNPYIEELKTGSRSSTSHKEYKDNSNINNILPTSHVREVVSRIGGVENRGNRGAPLPRKPNSYIKGLNLTEAGAIKLMAYPPGALEAALREMQSHKGEIRDPFVFYSRLCHNYCKDNEIVPDWGMCFNTLRSRGFEKDAVGVDKSSPLLYYTESEYQAMQPKKAPMYPDAKPPEKRVLDKVEEARKSEINITKMAKSPIPGMDDIFADIFKCIIRDGQVVDK